MKPGQSNVMFAIPPIIKKKYYVIVGMFPRQDWYLSDAGNKHDTIVRTWVTNPNKAIKFNTVSDAEQVGALVCDSDDFTVEGFTRLR